jgi:hypothetical protein
MCLLLLVSLHAKAQSDFECGRYAVWKEARGESRKVQRAVLDVLAARVRKTGKPMCKILKMRGQFPWRRYGIKSVDTAFVREYHVVTKMPHVFKEDSGYMFFNHVRHPWGKSTVKIGGLYFSK